MIKKTIYIDGWFLQPPQRGIGKYIKNILISIPKISEKFDFILLVPHNNLKNLNFPSHLKINIIPCKYILLWYEYFLPSLLNKSENSIIFFPSGSCGIFTFNRNYKVFSTIHDVASFLPLKYNPITFQVRHILGRIYRKISFYKLINNSKIIFTVSKTAKHGIEKVVLEKRLKMPKIISSYNASEIEKLKPSIKKKYFLCITGESRQKNYKCIIKALDYIRNNKLKGWKIYLIGLSNNLEFKHKCGINVVKRTYLGLDKIKELYLDSYCLIFPSIYESFGIPLVDALKSNCHILASNNGASFEVCGNSALYFDPNSPEQLSKKIIEIINKYPQNPFINYDTNVLKQTWQENSKFIFENIVKNC